LPLARPIAAPWANEPAWRLLAALRKTLSTRGGPFIYSNAQRDASE
jgi:hypothetical protein